MKVFEETFRAPCGQTSEEDARHILNEIRANHSKEAGWVELDAGVEQRADGRWYAWRKHKHQ